MITNTLIALYRFRCYYTIPFRCVQGSLCTNYPTGISYFVETSVAYDPPVARRVVLHITKTSNLFKVSKILFFKKRCPLLTSFSVYIYEREKGCPALTVQNRSIRFKNDHRFFPYQGKEVHHMKHGPAAHGFASILPLPHPYRMRQSRYHPRPSPRPYPSGIELCRAAFAVPITNGGCLT